MALNGPKVNGKPRFAAGPVTYAAYVAVAAGNVCSFGTAGNAGKVGPSAAGSIPLGVATSAALPAGTSATSTSASGYPNLDMFMPDELTALARHGYYYLLPTTAFAPGEFVKTGAAGGVAKFVVGTDVDTTQRVGQCVDPAGGVVGVPCLIEVNIG